MNANHALQIDIVASKELDESLRSELLALCSEAYEEDFSPFLDLLHPATHLLGRIDGELVSHAAWVERELRAGTGGALRTAYVEAVATLPAHQGRGYASELLRRIPPLLGDYAIAALSPSADAYYRRLGWELWLGPLSYVDRDGAEIPTPEEDVMIHRLPRTPPSLDLRAPLSTDWRPGDVW